VDAAAGLDRLGQQVLDVGDRAHVAHHRVHGRGRRELAGQLLETHAVEVAEDQRRAGRGEAPRRGAADTPAGAGDDDGRTAHVVRHALPLVAALTRRRRES